MQKTRKIRCPHCGFLDTIKKGKRSGHSRYFCKNCSSYFTDRRPHISDKNMFVWFEHWVRDKQSISQISKASGHSERTLLMLGLRVRNNKKTCRSIYKGYCLFRCCFGDPAGARTALAEAGIPYERSA